MNRAWIPAGALAGVSVAGLLALGPVTDSLSTPVEFAPSVQVAKQTAQTVKSSVPVSVNSRVVGETATAALKPRGGRAAISASNTDSGFVSINKNAATARSTTSNAPAVADAPTKPKVEPKKPPKRPESIGGAGELNSDQGFAGGKGSGAIGEQAGTPGT